MSEDLSVYIGKRYNFRRYNCWTHVKSVRDDFGIITKPFAPKTLKDAFKVITAQMQQLDHNMTKVSEPENFDIIISKKTHLGISMYHCGVYHDGNVNHCCNIFGSVRSQSLKEFVADYESYSIWR